MDSLLKRLKPFIKENLEKDKETYPASYNRIITDLSENIIQDDQIARLISFPNVLITAHQGFLTKEALQEIAKVTFQNILDFQAGKENENRVSK